MKGLCKGGKVALATVLLLASVAAAVPSAAAVAVPDDDPSLADWIGAWLARLVPGWALAAGEGEEAPPPPGDDGIAFDDPANSESCDPENPNNCGEGWPDFDPDG